MLKARLTQGKQWEKSYIFAGGSGQGKTTLARIFVRASLCHNLNKSDPEPCNECESCVAILSDMPSPFVEMDAASGGTVDTIRGIVADIPFRVADAPCRIYLFDEAHGLSKEAQNALLKPMEERKILGVFCTTEPHKILGTLRGRCESYKIRRVTQAQIEARMHKILTQEGVSFEPAAVAAVVAHAKGHVRNILNDLEMLSHVGSVTMQAVQDLLPMGMSRLYLQILLAIGDTPRAVELLEQACEDTAPADVAAGLAEAALGAYRQAQGLAVDFMWLDQDLTQQVWARFGEHTVALAEFFLRRAKVTQTSMVCDLVELAGSAPVEWVQRSRQQTVVSVPMVVVQTPVPESHTPMAASVVAEAVVAVTAPPEPEIKETQPPTVVEPPIQPPEGPPVIYHGELVAETLVSRPVVLPTVYRPNMAVDRNGVVRVLPPVTELYPGAGNEGKIKSSRPKTAEVVERIQLPKPASVTPEEWAKEFRAHLPLPRGPAK